MSSRVACCLIVLRSNVVVHSLKQAAIELPEVLLLVIAMGTLTILLPMPDPWIWAVAPLQPRQPDMSLMVERKTEMSK